MHLRNIMGKKTSTISARVEDSSQRQPEATAVKSVKWLKFCWSCSYEPIPHLSHLPKTIPPPCLLSHWLNWRPVSVHHNLTHMCTQCPKEIPRTKQSRTHCWLVSSFIRFQCSVWNSAIMLRLEFVLLYDVWQEQGCDLMKGNFWSNVMCKKPLSF